MMKIITDNKDKILRGHAKEVTEFNADLEKTVEEMIAKMKNPEVDDLEGVGLAANQVGILKRILIMCLNVNTKKELKTLVMINPKILKLSTEKSWMEEGCLSVPGLYEKVLRPKIAQVEWQDAKGNKYSKKLKDWDARIFLHEFDHLDGKLFIDYDNKK